jgi:hypothetical protein
MKITKVFAKTFAKIFAKTTIFTKTDLGHENAVKHEVQKFKDCCGPTYVQNQMRKPSKIIV